MGCSRRCGWRSRPWGHDCGFRPAPLLVGHSTSAFGHAQCHLGIRGWQASVFVHATVAGFVALPCASARVRCCTTACSWPFSRRRRATRCMSMFRQQRFPNWDAMGLSVEDIGIRRVGSPNLPLAPPGDHLVSATLLLKFALLASPSGTTRFPTTELDSCRSLTLCAPVPCS